MQSSKADHHGKVYVVCARAYHDAHAASLSEFHVHILPTACTGVTTIAAPSAVFHPASHRTLRCVASLAQVARRVACHVHILR